MLFGLRTAKMLLISELFKFTLSTHTQAKGTKTIMATLSQVIKDSKYPPASLEKLEFMINHFKNTGEKKEKTEWHRVVVFNEGLVNVVQQYLKKGAQIYVEGQLTTRKWKDEQSGQDKYSTEILIQGYNSSLTMLGGNNSSTSIANAPQNKNEMSQAPDNDLDDDIPF